MNDTHADEHLDIVNTITTKSWSIGLSIFDHQLFVADGLNNQILVYDLFGNKIKDISLKDTSDCSGHIHGIDVYNDLIYVVKENYDCIGIYDFDGNILNTFGSHGNGINEFNSPQYLKIFDEKIYVIDSVNVRIQIFDLDWKFINSIPISTSNFNEFASPGDFVINEDKIYVTIAKDNQIHIFDLNGKLLEILSGNENFSDPVGIEIYKNYIFIANGEKNKIQILNFDGEFINEIYSNFNDPHQIIIFDEKLYVLDTRNFQVKIFNLFDFIKNTTPSANVDLTKNGAMYFLLLLLIPLGIFLFKKLL